LNAYRTKHQNTSCSSGICDSGWHGRGEFIDRSGIDCNNNEVGIRIFYGILSLAIVILSILIVILLRRRLQRAINIAIARQQPIHNLSPIRIWLSDAPSQFALSALLFVIFIGAVTIQRAIATNNETYHSWSVCLTTAIGAGLFWSNASIFVSVLITSSTLSVTVRGGAAAAQVQLQRLYRILWVARIYSIFVGCAPIAIRLSTTEYEQVIATQVHLSAGSSCGLWILLFASYFCNKVVTILATVNTIPRISH
jgi:hypothetical protein